MGRKEWMKSICRICLTKGKHLKPILQYITLIANCVNIEINTDDGLPDLICKKCVEKVNEIVKFKELCEKSESILKNVLLVNIKIEETPETFECNSYNSEEFLLLSESKIEFIDNCDSNFINSTAADITDIDVDSLVPIALQEVEIQQSPNDLSCYNDIDSDITNALDTEENDDFESPINPSTIENQIKQTEKMKCATNIPNNEVKQEKDNRLDRKRKGDDINTKSTNLKITTVKPLIRTCHICNCGFFNFKNFKKHMLSHSNCKTVKPKIKPNRSQVDLQEEDIQQPPNNFNCYNNIDSHTTNPSDAEENDDFESQINPSTIENQIDQTAKTNSETNIPNNENPEVEEEDETMDRERKKDGINTKSTYFKSKLLKSSIRICHICNRGFISFKNFKNHMLSHSNSVKVQPNTSNSVDLPVCQYCGIRCKTLPILRKHEQIHTGICRFKCPEPNCSKAFYENSQLRIHLITHSDSTPHLCNLCGKRFKRVKVLRKHTKDIHSETPRLRNHKCMICNAAFFERRTLNIHVRLHSDERPYVCKVCNKGFKKRYGLSIHEKIHTGYRPHVCSECGKAFLQKQVLISHLKTHAKHKKV